MGNLGVVLHLAANWNWLEGKNLKSGMVRISRP